MGHRRRQVEPDQTAAAPGAGSSRHVRRGEPSPASKKHRSSFLVRVHGCQSKETAPDTATRGAAEKARALATGFSPEPVLLANEAARTRSEPSSTSGTSRPWHQHGPLVATPPTTVLHGGRTLAREAPPVRVAAAMTTAKGDQDLAQSWPRLLEMDPVRSPPRQGVVAASGSGSRSRSKTRSRSCRSAAGRAGRAAKVLVSQAVGRGHGVPAVGGHAEIPGAGRGHGAGDGLGRGRRGNGAREASRERRGVRRANRGRD